MSRPAKTSQPLAVPPVYLAARAINGLMRVLPSGTAYFIGLVLMTMFTGQLVPHQGSLARAALPPGIHLRWGWHRVERAMARGKVSLDALFDRARTGCLEGLPVEPVRLGRERRTVPALDSSPVVRLRANTKRGALLGKGDCPRAQRAVPANLLAVLTTGALLGGGRVGLVRRTRFGATCQEAAAKVFAELPDRRETRLFSVDAGVATVEQVRAATERDALVGRLRKNGALRRAPTPRRSRRRGRPALHGPVLHPGAKQPEGRAAEDPPLRVAERAVRVRRWRKLHFREAPQTVIDVVRGDDPAYQRPLRIGTTACELRTDETRTAYSHRWPVEANFSVAQGSCAMAQPRAWAEKAIARRIRLALRAGSLRKAIAAGCEPLPMGPWDLKAVASAGRVANHLGLHVRNFAALARQGLAPRKYGEIAEAQAPADLQLPLAA